MTPELLRETGELDPLALAELERSFGGEIVRRGGPGYDERRRVWNGSIDRHPSVIARCASAADVSAVVRLAASTGAPLAVRGGGHSFPGHSSCDDGVVADLRPMSAIAVDPEARRARVGAGALLGELDEATQRYGLAVPSGIVTHTGVAGLTLGGGIGWLQRRLGLTIDQLVGAEVVTAAGELVRASAEENADLFWGIRGGGGNFGIVTAFEFRLNEVGPAVLGGPIFWPMAESENVLRFYRDWITEAPDELMTIAVHRRVPALPTIPAEFHDEPVVGIACCWCGPLDEGERVIAPLRRHGRPLLDMCAVKPFLENQAMFDPSFPHGRWYYMRACDVGSLSDEVIEIAAEYARRMRSPLTAFPIWQMGGAVSRVDDGETAFNGRHDGHTFNITAMTDSETGFEEEREWVRDFWSALEPHHTGSVYVNFLMEEGEDRVRAAYGAERYDRLKALKRKYDPQNLFRLNQNIPPT